MSASSTEKLTAAQVEEQQLLDWLSEREHDPLAFVEDGFPWGEEGSILADEDGPDAWQVEVLSMVRDKLITVADAISVLQVAVASGHGVGKSALVAWLILWAFTTKPDTRGIVTANTDTQLRTKTWAELSKWFGLFIGKGKFRVTATAIFSRDHSTAMTWRIDQTPWSKETLEAFAGLHNKGKRILIVYDEASAIPDLVWETTEGALTDKDTEILWFVFGNPTRNTGRFRECFGKFRHRWERRQVDSRTARVTNKAQIAKWVKDYGEDSDFVRVRVRGVFPRAGSMQFIPGDLVEAAIKREALSTIADPLVIGVDVARFGDDKSVIIVRKGRDARTHPMVKLRGSDLMATAARVFAVWQELRADALFVDDGGVGGGVTDRLRQLGVPVIGVNFGGKPDRISYDGAGLKYANKRAEMWGNMRSWLESGGALPDDNEIVDDLTGVEYGYDAANNIQLERKADMKKRGLASPDIGDALALTFAYPVAPNANAGGAHRLQGSGGVITGAGGVRMAQTDYDPFDI